MPPVDVVGEQTETPHTALPTSDRIAAGGSVLPLNPLHKIKLSSVLDQVSDAEVQLLSPEVVLDEA